ncbi:MAG: DUF808 family protein [Patescibacteria group bacterium]|nr:DUF808 family protein [Patescibacteria group bacterium]
MTSSLLLFKKAALIMDKVSAATKLTLKGTAGVVVDDLVVGATKASEFDTEKEKKSVFAIRDGSLKFLLIILVVLFTIQYFVPSLIIWILIIGGIILSVEAYHAVTDFLGKESHDVDEKDLTDEEKIKSAINTSIILNIEIVVIAMSMVQDFSFLNQILAVSIASIGITYTVYAIVLGLVRTDDVGLEMMENNKPDSFKYKVGDKLVIGLPYVMKGLMYAGAYAMALVGGEILVHNIDIIHHFHEESLSMVPGLLFYPLIGIIAGFIADLVLKVNSYFMKHISI